MPLVRTLVSPQKRDTVHTSYISVPKLHKNHHATSHFHVAADPKAVKKDKPPQPSAGVAASPVAMLRMPELLNERAVSVIQRVSRKLTGRDFGDTTMDVPAQVQRLIEEASSAEALCQSYMGWCPFW